MENKEKYLIGGWNDFAFKMIEPQDYDQVLQFVKEHFITREPTCRLLGYSEDFGNEVASYVKIMLMDNMSFMAIHKDSNELAGVRITYKHKDEPDPEVPIQSPQALFLLKILKEVETKSDIFNRFKITYFADFFVACTAPKFCQKGLATEMYKRSLRYLKAVGFSLAKSVFTSPYTRRAAGKLGFEEIFRLNYNSLMDENGEPVFPGLIEETYAAILVKKLDDIELFENH